MNRKHEAIKKAAYVNGCSDDYTRVPIANVNENFEKGTSMQLSLVIMSITMLIMSVIGFIWVYKHYKANPTDG